MMNAESKTKKRRKRPCLSWKSNKKEDIIARREFLKTEWCTSLNGDKSIEDYGFFSEAKVYFKCNKAKCEHHVWLATIGSRMYYGQGCPYCSGRRVCSCHNFATRYPELAKQWHPTLNNKSPAEYSPKSGQKVWWLCPNSHCGHHIWSAVISDRTHKGSGCPYCYCGVGQKVCPCRNFKTEYPQLAKEWDVKLNKAGPETFSPSSHALLSWQCLEDATHPSWTATINARSKGTNNCPKCYEKTQTIGERKMMTALHELYGASNVKTEAIFPDLRYKNPLRYDFIVRSGIIIDKPCIFEFDGSQHFRNCNWFREELRIKDRIKNKYAIAHCYCAFHSY